MSKIDDGGLFFPIKDDGWNPGLNGITRRDWLAGKFAPQIYLSTMLGVLFTTKMGMDNDLTQEEIVKAISKFDTETIPEEAYQLADKMIAESKKGGDK